jgi:3-isopropylmalate/(R)-2-methylmalate dehydratase large subunit
VGQTVSEKILGAKSGVADARAGQLVVCKVDRVLATDITAPLSIDVFRRMGAERVHDPDACILVNDHFVPAKDVRSADFSAAMRKFAAEQGISRYFEVGRSGICHNLIAEMALVLPGQILLGADSHTLTAGGLGCYALGVGSTDLAAAWALGELWFMIPQTVRVEFSGEPMPFVGGKDLGLRTLATLGVEGGRYRAVEFFGAPLSHLAMEDRFTLCNLAAEMGAKVAMVPPDDQTLEYIRSRTSEPFEVVRPDPDARYEDTFRLDISGMEPQVSEPFLPSRARGVSEFREVQVDQVFIGSCTNGSLQDLRQAARILKGRKVAAKVRCIVTPATQGAYLGAAREGILEALVEAGCAVTTPTCGACLGGHMGVLGAHEVALATTNRNFRGRMGDPTSRVYLANPSVAAATAVLGRIAHPEEVVG